MVEFGEGLPKDINELRGKRCLVFDSRLWEKNGGDSEKDDFFRPALIVRTYWKNNDALADVLFDYRPVTLSKGHFVHAIKTLPTGAATRSQKKKKILPMVVRCRLSKERTPVAENCVPIAQPTKLPIGKAGIVEPTKA